MANETIVMIVKVFAGLATLFMVASPMVSVFQIIKQKHVGLYSVIPFVSLLANSHIWMMYGYLTARYFPIFSMFLIGDLLAVFYLSVYWRFTTERAYMKKVLAFVLLFLVAMSVYAILGGLGLSGQTDASFSATFGGISVFMSLCLYGAPMEKIFQVLRHKSGAFFNFPMVIAAIINNLIWMTYGLLTDFWYITGPHILFATIGFFAVFLYFKYNPKTHPVVGIGKLINQACEPEARESLEQSAISHLQLDIDLELDAVAVDCSRKFSAGSFATSPTYQAMRSPLQPLHM